MGDIQAADSVFDRPAERPPSAEATVETGFTSGTSESVWRERAGELESALRETESLLRQNRRRLEEVSRAFGREREVAAALRRAYVPALPPELPGLEVGHTYLPVEAGSLVGGDFYDLFLLGKGHWGLALGDVSGKGSEAALVASMTRHVLRGAAGEGEGPAALLGRLNRLLAGHLASDRFVSLFYAEIDPEGGRLRYASAGHEPGILETSREGKRFLDSTGPLLGILNNPLFEEFETEFPRGASLLVYTDGIPDARFRQEFFGSGGIEAVMDRTRSDPPSRRVQSLVEAARRHSGAPLRDDVAILLLHNAGE